MLDELIIVMALPRFLRNENYPRSLRLAVLTAVVGAILAALMVSIE